jgi:NAD(P)-dependent dehydrogenase (short-subunit alcohol dehydrogenase family)
MITGASQGFGLELVRAALQRGDSVMATSRNPQKVVYRTKSRCSRIARNTLALDWK